MVADRGGDRFIAEQRLGDVRLARELEAVDARAKAVHHPDRGAAREVAPVEPACK